MQRRTLLAATSTLLALPALVRAQALEKPKLTIAVGGKNLLYYLPLTIAETQGFFKAEGLDVTIADFAGGSQALRAVVGGSADVVSGAFEHTVNMQFKGQRLRAFARTQGGAVMIKPLDGYAGNGIFLWQEGDRNGNVILETATHKGQRAVMAQRYMPEARAGDKRVLLLDGEPVGVLLRLPNEDDHRSNLAAGGHGVRGELTARDREIIARVQPRLRRDGLLFVGLDIVGGHLTEVVLLGNVAMRAGQPIEWDTATKTVKNLPDANRLIDPPYRAGWKL